MSNKSALLDAVYKSVKDYCDAHHDFSFDKENPVVRLHEPTFSTDEIMAGLECMLTTHVTMGAKVKKFEGEFSQKHTVSNGVMVNSGSSANLLALATVVNPETTDALRPGDEVIVPALSWSTTVWPIIQMGLVPVIVDIDPQTLNIDPNEIERAIGPKTRAVMIVPVYGNPCDMTAIMNICHKHNLCLIEDCCEALGASYDGKPLGSFGRVGTYSFYYSHHITTLEGGMCTTNDFDFAENMRILRAHGWLREVEKPEKWTVKYPDVNPRFLFVNVGYNLRATELQGAMGSVQLPKLEGFVNTRRENAKWFQKELSKYDEFFRFQQETPKGYHSWFGFSIILKLGTPFSVEDIMAALKADNIETRPIICGNIALQPGISLYQHRTVGDLEHATDIMHNGFSFGNHQAINSSSRAYVVGKIIAFMKTQGIS